MNNRLREIFFASGGIRKTVFKNFMWLGVSQVGSRFIRAAITIYSARALGAGEYGVFSYALGLAGFFVIFKNIGVDAIITREIAKDPSSRDKVFSTGFWIEIGLLIVTAMLLLFIAPLFSKIDEAIMLLPIVAIMLIADDLRDFFIAFFRGVEKMEWEAFVITMANVSATVFGFIALAYSKTPISLVVSYTTASLLVTFIAGGIIFWRYGFRVIKNFSSKLVLPILKSAWPIAATALPGMFLFNIDLVMLGWWKSVSEIGVYSAAQKLIGVLAIFSTLVATSTFPVFARFAHAKDSEKMRSLTENTLKIIFLFCIPIIMGGILLGTPLLKYIYGSEYSSGGTAFFILLFSILMTHPLTIITNFVFAYDVQRKIVLFPFIVGILSLVLNLFLIPRYGIIGAALSTLISFSLYIFLMYRFARGIEYFKFFPKPQKIFFSGLIMFVGVAGMKIFGIHVIINIIVSAGIYVASLFLLKEEAVSEILGLFKK